MPEISDSDYRSFVAYQNLGSPQELSKKITDLESDNKGQRDEIRDLKEKLPKAGSVVLEKPRADALAAYEALGKPEEVKAIVEKVPTLEGEIAKRSREDAFRAAVKAAQWPEDTVATLLDMRSLDGAEVEVRREKNEQGEDVEVPYVTLPGDGQTAQKLSEFAANAPQLKGLKTEAAQQETTATGTRYTRETGTASRGGGGKATDEDVRKATESTANYTL